MDLSNLNYAPRSRKKPKRVGRGDASGHGGTSTRGHKGQRSRSGSRIRPGFEGGQMPLQRRIPKRGFHNIFRVEYQAVNLGSIQKLSLDTVTPEVMAEKRLIRKRNLPVKILGTGEIDRAVEVHAHGFSQSAKEKIEKAGGKAITLASQHKGQAARRQANKGQAAKRPSTEGQAAKEQALPAENSSADQSTALPGQSDKTTL